MTWMYQGRKFTRAQLTFMVEAILASAVDLIDAELPLNDEEKRTRVVGNYPPLTPYDKGALDTAGEAISILYVQIARDENGLGAYDALYEANHFDDAVIAWAHSRLDERAKGLLDVRPFAEAFVSNLFADYLKGVTPDTD